MTDSPQQRSRDSTEADLVGSNSSPNSPEEFLAFPLSPAQERMWRADRSRPGDPAFNASFRWSLEGPLDRDILERACNEIISRHEVLRASFPLRGGQPVELIASAKPLHIVLTDLRHLPASVRESEMERLCAEEAERSFQLEAGPLIRIGLLQLKDEQCVLLLTLHHIVTDGWSIGVIMEELQKIYSAFAEGRPSPLSDLAVQYPDYVLWQQQRMGDENIAAQLSYWKNRFSDYRRLEVASDYPRPAARTTKGAIVSCLLPRTLTDALREFGNQQGGTMFVTTLAACMALLQRYTGETDIAIGSPFAGRGVPESDRLIGLFINHLVFRANASGDPLFSEFALRVRETAWEAFANQEVPFENVVKEVWPGEDAYRNPFYAINFICQREYARASTFVFEFAGIRMSTMPSKSQGALYDLNFFMVERESGWRLSLEYNTDLYRESTAQQMLDHFRELLVGIQENPNRRLSEFPLSGGSVLPRHESLPAASTAAEPEAPQASAATHCEEAPTTEKYAMPVSLTQRRFWSLEEIAPGNPRLHMAACVVLTGTLSPDLLRKSFQALVDRHETLRTTFEEIDGKLSQVITSARAFDLPVTSLEDLPEAQRQPRLEEMLQEEARIAFDLHHGPLMRARLFLLSPWESVLLTTTHHTLADGWSQNIMQRELWIIYESLAAGTTSSLQPLAIQYGDFAHWQNQWLGSEEAREHLEFWTERLSGRLPVLDFPLDRPIHPQASSEGAIETLLFSQDLVRKLKSSGQKQDVTMFMLMLACFAVLLYRYAGEEDILIGSPVANRKPETEPLIGPFAGPVCLRLDLSGNPTLKEVLSRVREVVFDALSHTDLPFEALLDKLDTRSVRGRNPLFQFYFFYQTAFLQPRVLADLTVTPGATLGLGTSFEIQLGLVERKEGLRAQLEYNRDLFDPATIREILTFYETLSTAFVETPGLRVSDLPVPERALHRMQDLPATRPDYVSPRNSTELQLAQIWTDLLGVDRPGIRDDFFESGGHSLLAIKAVSRIRDIWGVDVPLRRFFAEATIAGLAAAVVELRGAERVGRIERRKEKGAMALSYAQERLWFLDQLMPGSAAYNIVEVMKWGRCDAGVMKRAVQELVGRHESLRTRFRKKDGQPVQEVVEGVEVEVKEVDLRGLGEREREVEWKRVGREEAGKPFDLREAPLVRVSVVKMGEGEDVVLWVIHHIIFDEWSMEVVRRELREIYEGLAEGRRWGLAELPIQYGDYAVWQRERMKGEVLEEELGYWKKQLQGAPVLLELPTDKVRPAVQSFRGATEVRELGKGLVEGLKGVGREEGATLFMTLAAAFMVLLYRYTGQEDILVGTPISGRTRSETENLIGFFLNTVVLRGRMKGEDEFRDVLRGVREQSVGAYGHQEVPFERVVAEMAPERELSHTPLFQVMFVVHGGEGGAGVEESRGLSGETAKFDLTLSVTEKAEGLVGLIEYSTDLFEAETIGRMFGHYERLLAEVVRDAGQRVGKMRMLGEEEEEKLLVEWNGTGEEWGREVCVHEKIEEQVKVRGEEVAVVSGGKRISYGELNERANQVAHYLRRQGVGPEVLVGVCLERSIEMVVALLGILKAGGAYVPLDLSYPSERLAFMIADSKPSVVLTQETLRERLLAKDSRIVCLDADAELIARESKDDLHSGANPDNLAYVIYTSGSTGKPKGVAVTHYNVMRLFQSTSDWFQFNERDVWTVFHSYAFDFSVWELWGALLHGGRAIVVPYLVSRSPEEFCRLLQEERVTVLNQTPSSFRQLIDADERLAPELSLRLVIFGGEALEMRSLKPWFARHGDQVPQLVNMYGITETTVHVTYRPLSMKDTAAGSVIGQPIPDLRIYLLDKNRELVPAGVPGEIYVGGAGVARGYVNRPELTAERFIPNPFRSGAATRLYRSGDSARYLSNGDIEYLGRIDQQVKIRGFRIELGEIETLLAQHPSVGRAVVALREDVPGDRRLVAYIVAPDREDREDQAAAGLHDELRGYLSKKLPDYMVPSAYVLLESLPLTANGKVDYKALPAASSITAERGDSYEAPRTPEEESITLIWEELLPIRPGIRDDFFESGGHSLLAIKAVSRIRDIWGVDVPLRRFFAEATIAGLAAAVVELRGAERVGRIERRKEKGAMALSYAQERLWFLDQLMPGSAAYNIVEVMKWGRCDAGVMKRAVQELVGRHESLRTRFRKKDGQPVQEVVEGVEVEVKEVDLRGLGEREREVEWKRVGREEAGKPFDLREAPLVRVSVVKMGEGEDVVLWVIHHIIFDEWSMEVVRRELREIYEGLAEGRRWGLAELPIQYGDYAVWQRERMKGEVLEEELGYWKKQLQGAPVLLELPTDKVRPAVQSFRGATEVRELGKGLVEGLKGVGREEGATLFMTLAAAFMVLLYRYTGQEDILVGTPISGRTRSETENLIGFFLNTVVLRGRMKGEDEFRDVLRGVREQSVGAYGHQEVPFERVVAEMAPERELSHTPLFQVMFVVHGGEGGAGVEESRGLSGETAKFDLTLSVTEKAEGLVGLIEYSTDLFEAETIGRMFGHYERLLAEVVRDAGQRVGKMRMLGEEEEEKLLVEWNGTGEEWGREVCVHEKIEEQVKVRGEEVAVVSGGKRISYGELNERANQVAHYLRRQGVGPEVLVGVCLERSIEMVVALLGILKAGGAYVPLDPEYPIDRLAAMMDDCHPPVILTQTSLLDRLASYAELSLCLDSAAVVNMLGKEPKTNPSTSVNSTNAVYVIYTSGSTGRPKGVVNVHRGVVNRLLWMQRAYPLNATDRVLQKTPYSFDVSVWEFFWPLMTGARLVMARPGGHRDPAYLADVIAREKITTLHFVPSMLHIFLESAKLPRQSSLRRIFCSGEALSAELRDALFAHLDVELYNLYGPTEAAVDVTHWTCRPGDKRPFVPIGRPIANTQIYILDRQLQPTPIGVPGELHIGGIGLARGYLHQPELTAERFIVDPFATDPRVRLYKTGDLARFLPSGEIEYLGRLDFQIKLRGFRIELGEIESVIREYPGIRQAVVLAREDASRERRLVAYIVSDDAQVRPVELREFLRKKLPEYMVPAGFITLPELPLSSNGKIDRKALAQLSFGEALEPREFAEPSTETEKELASIWKEILGIATVGVHDNFFDLGGHSLTAVKLLTRIQERLGKELPLASLLEAQTVEQQARLIRGESARPEKKTAVGAGAFEEIPLFYLGGDPTFRPLSQSLSALHEFHSLGMQESFVKNMKPPYPLESIAEHFVTAVRERQPEGPYILGGWCSHGLLALEVAQQLRALGHEVALLILLETVQPLRLKESAAWKWQISRLQLKLHLLKFEYAYLRQLRRPQAVHYISGRVSHKASSIWQSIVKFLGPPRKRTGVQKTPVSILYEAAASYRPKPYPGPVVLFRSLKRTFGFAQALRLGWDSEMADLQVCETPGNHYTFYMAPNVDVLAREMSARMRHAEERIGSLARGMNSKNNVSANDVTSRNAMDAPGNGIDIGRAQTSQPAREEQNLIANSPDPFDKRNTDVVPSNTRIM